MANKLLRLKTAEEIAKYIEYAFLDNTATAEEMKLFAQQAKKYNFYGVVVGSTYVKYMKKLLKDTQIKVISVVDFPLGFGNTASRISEAKQAVEDGADEIDIVINIPAVKNKKYDLVKEDIDSVKEAIPNTPLKIIIETTILTDKEVATVSKIIEKTDAEFIKTCTGFSGKNNFNDFVNYLIIIHKYAPSKEIKASGGISNFKEANNVIASGATRIGTSRGPQIIEQLKKASESTEANAPGLFEEKPKYEKRDKIV